MTRPWTVHPARRLGGGPIKSSILVAEDDASVLEALASLLESLGHAVTRTRNGRAAWDRLIQGTTFDLLVTDVSMPLMGGLELLAAAREARPWTPVVVISGDPANRALALGGGATGYVDKPFRPGLLEAEVARALSAPRGLVVARHPLPPATGDDRESGGVSP